MAKDKDFSHLNLKKISEELWHALNSAKGTDNAVIQRIARLAQKYGSKFVNEVDKLYFFDKSLREELIKDHDGGEAELYVKNPPLVKLNNEDIIEEG